MPHFIPDFIPASSACAVSGSRGRPSARALSYAASPSAARAAPSTVRGSAWSGTVRGSGPRRASVAPCRRAAGAEIALPLSRLFTRLEPGPRADERLHVRRRQFGARIGAQVVGEHAPGLLVRHQRLGRALGRAQRTDELRMERLVQRVVRYQFPKLRQHLPGMAQRQIRVNPAVQRRHPQRLRARPGRLPARQVRRRRPPRERRAALTYEPLESAQIDVLHLGKQPVSARARGDGLPPRRPPQPPRQRLQRPRRILRRLRPHTSSISASTDAVWGARSAGVASSAHRRPPPNAMAVPCALRAAVEPRIRGTARPHSGVYRPLPGAIR